MDYKKTIEQMIADGVIPQEAVEKYCPELKESEDERIRKALIDIVNARCELYKGITKEMFLAWLKKQGEQKPAEWSEEDEKMLCDVIKDLVHPWDEYIPDRIEEEIKWLKNKLKSLRPQNRWKPSDEQMKALEHFVRSIAESGFASPYDSNTKLVYSLFNDLKKLREE